MDKMNLFVGNDKSSEALFNRKGESSETLFEGNNKSSRALASVSTPNQLPPAPIQDEYGNLTFELEGKTYSLNVNSKFERIRIKAEVNANSLAKYYWFKEETGEKHWVLYDIAMYEIIYNSCLRYIDDCTLTPVIPINATSCHRMFHGCKALTQLNLSNFNTSQITDMSSMFAGCEKLTELDLSNFDTHKVTNMSGMFDYCKKVKTTIDCNAQEKLQKAVDSNLAQFTKKQKDGEFLVQGAATVVDNITGKVVAIVGGRTQKSEEGNGRTLNRAFQSYNQPGSTIKPLVVYTPAFEKGYNPDTIVNDQKFDGGPSNSDGLYKGLIKVSQAVIESRNTVAWQILDDISPKTGLKYVQNMNFSHIVPSDYYDAAALGGLTYGVNTVEMASGYATIKNGGIYRKSTCIDSIEDSEGNEVKAGEMPSRVYKQYATKEITEIMQDVIKKGTGRGLSLERGMPSAGKTGTTNNQRSGWFCGFSPYYSIAVWVGTDNNDEVKDLWGGTYPGNIWKDSMNALCSGKTVVPFDTTLTQSDLLEKSGKSANSSTATTEKKAATTATTESNNSEEEDDDIVSRLNDLIYDYEDAEIQNDSDLAKIDSIESEIEDLLTKLKTKDNKNFYRKVYKQAKGEVQKKINQYRSSLGGSSTQTPTDQTTSNTTTESTEGDNSSGSTTESNVDDSDDNDSGGSNEEFGWQN